jgi:tetratricopeptide (TPR) repeat protein
MNVEYVPQIDEVLALCRIGKLDDARLFLDAYSAEHPNAFAAHLLLARIHADQNRWPSALGAARAALSLQASDAGAWYALGRANQGLSNTGAAVSCYRRALRIESRNPQILAQLGHTLQSVGQRDQAIRLYQAALIADPQQAEARAKLDQLVGPVPGGMQRLDQIREDASRLHAAAS